MDKKIMISTDSTSDIPKEIQEELNITVLPMPVIINGVERQDGVDITPKEMYHIINNSSSLPTSAAIPVYNYVEYFERAWNEGYTDIIHTCVNSKGSATYNNALLAIDMFYQEVTQAKGLMNICILDSCTYSMGYGLGVIEAAKLNKNGASAEEIIDFLEDWIKNVRVAFVPLELRCVKKSGRVSAAAAFFGDAIGLKPIISFEDGESKIKSKVRGESAAIKAIITACAENRREGTPFAIALGENSEANRLLLEASAEINDASPFVYDIGGVIAINTGPNALGIIYKI